MVAVALVCALSSAGLTQAIDAASLAAPVTVYMPYDTVAMIYNEFDAGTNLDNLKIAEWDPATNQRTLGPVPLDTARSHIPRLKVNTANQDIFVAYAREDQNFQTLHSLHLKRIPAVGTISTWQTRQLMLPTLPNTALFPNVVNFKVVGVDLDIKGNGEVHVAATLEGYNILSQIARGVVVYYKITSTSGAQVNHFSVPYNVIHSSSIKFGTHLGLKFLSSNSQHAVVTFPELTSSTQSSVKSWLYDTNTQAFPAITSTFPAAANAWSGMISGQGRARPFDMLVDPTASSQTSVRGIVIGTNALQYNIPQPAGGVSVLSSPSFSVLRTLQNTGISGPWGAGALALVQNGAQRDFHLVALEGDTLGSVTNGGKELRLYRSPENTSSVSQCVDSTSAASQYYSFPAATTNVYGPAMYIGGIYKGAANYEVRLFSKLTMSRPACNTTTMWHPWSPAISSTNLNNVMRNLFLDLRHF